MEKRKDIRYQVDAHAAIFWETSQHQHFRARGVIHNMSVVGAFILTAAYLPIDIPVQVEVILNGVIWPASILRFKGVAHVVRVERSFGGIGKIGFAVVRENFMRWNMTITQDRNYKTGSYLVTTQPRVRSFGLYHNKYLS